MSNEPDGDWPEDKLGPRLGTYDFDFIVDPALNADEWRARLKWSRQGNLTKSAENIMLILEHDPAWRGVLSQDERTLDVMITTPPFGNNAQARQISDADVIDACVWMGNNYDCEPSQAMMAACMNTVANHNPFDRVRDYLEALTWDGTERLPLLLKVYFGADANEYTSAIGQRWMVSAVARTLEPGCKADHVLVIEGDQGTGKSTALRVLCGNDEWFGDSIPNIDNKDAQQYLGGTWIVELAEMDAANRAEASTLKQFVSSPIDRYRPPYGRFMVNQPRRCVFAGTVNHGVYLKDETGGRRFWCFASKGMINLQGLLEDRDQLWAEAVAKYRRGEPWHLEEPALLELARREQAERHDADVWEDRIVEWLNEPKRRHQQDNGFTVAEILQGAIEMDASRQNQSHKNRVGRVMRGLEGWEFKQVRKGNARVKVWRTCHTLDFGDV
jgi:putative DNA primase/helicase